MGWIKENNEYFRNSFVTYAGKANQTFSNTMIFKITSSVSTTALNSTKFGRSVLIFVDIYAHWERLFFSMRKLFVHHQKNLCTPSERSLYTIRKIFVHALRKQKKGGHTEKLFVDIYAHWESCFFQWESCLYTIRKIFVHHQKEDLSLGRTERVINSPWSEASPVLTLQH